MSEKYECEMCERETEELIELRANNNITFVCWECQENLNARADYYMEACMEDF